MNGKIDKQGRLFIERSSSFYKIQGCPLNPSGNDWCGNWCPQFSEPVKENRQTKIEICHGKTLDFNEFKDERSR